jgi:hypothetical protein
MIDQSTFVLLFAGLILILFLVALVMFARIFGP